MTIVDIVDKAVKHSFDHVCHNEENDINCLNSLEKLACKLQLGCLWKAELNQVTVRKMKNTKLILSNSSNDNKVLTWRNVAGLKECAHCHKKHKLLRVCRKCKEFFFCSKKCQKIDWKQNEKHRKLCRKLKK